MTAERATAETISEQAVRIAATEGAIQQLNTVNGTSASALVQAFLGLSGTVDGEGDDLGEVIGEVQQLNTVNLSSTSALVQAFMGMSGTVEGHTGAIDTLRDVKIDAAGALARIEQEIAVQYGSLQAMAQATSFAEATSNGIVSGYIWNLNGQNVWTLVSASDEVTPPVTIATIDTDLVRIANLAQIEQAVISQLAAETAFLNNLFIGRAQITDTLESDNWHAPTLTGLKLDFANGEIFGSGITVRRINIVENTFDVHTASEPEERSIGEGDFDHAFTAASAILTVTQAPGAREVYFLSYRGELRAPTGGGGAGRTILQMARSERNSAQDPWGDWEQLGEDRDGISANSWRQVEDNQQVTLWAPQTRFRVEVKLADALQPTRTNVRSLEFFGKAVVV
ncbi:MAG: hypothetical protein QNJ09_11910 [Paracoccaceae bacterium]|nr:hypothetical protein [Paracoccaceae bacterium]